jgi:hypothetical protein
VSDLEQRVAALEAQVRLLQDIEDVREAISRYGFYADLGLGEEYVANWTADGVYDTGPNGVFRGHDELRAFVTDPDGVHKRDVEGHGSQHIGTNLVVRVDGDAAWAEGYSVVMVRGGTEGYRVFTAGYNHWELRREEGRWRIAVRRRADIGDVHLPNGTWGGAVMTGFQKTL